MTLVLEGDLIVEMNGTRHILGPGDAVLLPAWVEHGVTAGDVPVVAVDAWFPPPGHLGPR